jgi:hypothetical protein
MTLEFWGYITNYFVRNFLKHFLGKRVNSGHGEDRLCHSTRGPFFAHSPERRGWAILPEIYEPEDSTL